MASPTPTVLHANWSHGQLHFWAESIHLPSALAQVVSDSALIRQALEQLLGQLGREDLLSIAKESSLALALPSHAGLEGKLTPAPSPMALHMLERALANAPRQASLDDSSLAVIEEVSQPILSTHSLTTLAVPAEHVGQVLEALELVLDVEAQAATPSGVALAYGPTLPFFVAVDRFVRWLLVQQRFVPALVQDASGGIRGLWQPWLADDFVAKRVAALLATMPPSARAAVDASHHDAWATLEDFLVRITDARCRLALNRQDMAETISRRRAKPGQDQPDPHVTWLSGLLDPPAPMEVLGARRTDLLKRVRSWIGGLDQRSADTSWRLCFKLIEPINVQAASAEIVAPSESLRWSLVFLLQSIDSPNLTIAAQDIWILPTDGAMVSGRRIEQPQELLLAELGRAARVYPPLENAMRTSEPSEFSLTTVQAHEFLREHRQLLVEQGFGVLAPAWWDSPSARLGVRLRIDSPDQPVFGSPTDPALRGNSPTGSSFGLANLVNYKWNITLGQTNLTLEEFQKLANMTSPLVFVGGKWVEVRPEDIKAAVEFLRSNPGGQIEIGSALRMAFSADEKTTGLPVLGIETTGWVANVFGAGSGDGAKHNLKMPTIEPPPSFVGSLRPYQLKGLSWLAFLDKLGLGTCLADDMGLGKTIQFLALLLYERNDPSQSADVAGTSPSAADKPQADASAAAAQPEASPVVHGVPPTLLIVPMSVVGNWLREAKRFAPSLRVLIHHGSGRLTGRALADAALQSDLVITTYALAHRDREHLEPISWARVALDEAQNIKNAGTKQAQAVRAIDAPRRVALTGTPVENRLGELWSIMDFLNPGLLGTAPEFRQKFAVPIERFNDPTKGTRLRALVQPFVLRRLKSDPMVIADLPEKVETKEFCYLTPEQASLYEQTVKTMLNQVESLDGIARRGVILAGLMRLKQICNHPEQFLRATSGNAKAAKSPITTDDEESSPGLITASAQRSGKVTRLVQMLDEVVASGGRALVFTQFRVMGEMLQHVLRSELKREVLLLHGGTSMKDREDIIARFQRHDPAAPIFVLSLKAGGTGLNLTAANHVFHFDRWWNPAVENQATDRAFRIGQTRTVQVHKFVVSGTLEEKIDAMIESKAALADNVIGSGEQWLTELSLSQLRDVLTLRDEDLPSADETELSLEDLP